MPERFFFCRPSLPDEIAQKPCGSRHSAQLSQQPLKKPEALSQKKNVPTFCPFSPVLFCGCYRIIPLTIYALEGIFISMKWEVEYTDEFGEWWDSLTEREQESVRATVKLLEDYGPNLPFPHSSEVKNSRHSHMRELRIQHGGRPYRVLHTFDPRRCAILLIGGDKTGNDRWYEEYVPIADRLYDEHLETLKKEKSEDGS